MTHEKVHDFLKHHPVGVLSTVSDTNKPWGAAIYFAVNKDFNFYFVTRTGTLKFQNLDTNPAIALTIADPATQTTVQVAGTASKLPVDQYMKIFDMLQAIRPKDDLGWVPPVDKVHEGNFMAIQLTPESLQYANYGQQKLDAHATYVEKII